jgi:hypothetical protein
LGGDSHKLLRPKELDLIGKQIARDVILEKFIDSGSDHCWFGRLNALIAGSAELTDSSLPAHLVILRTTVFIMCPSGMSELEKFDRCTDFHGLAGWLCQRTTKNYFKGEFMVRRSWHRGC